MCFIFQYSDLLITAISDTHGKHRALQIPPCDILIHLGDVCNGGDEEVMRDFFDWFSAQEATHKLFVYGNHDLPFELDMELAQQMVPESVLFLNDAVVTIAGITFAAVNAVPYLHFDVSVEESIDILLSHGAPYFVLDDGKGCKRLYDLLLQAKPQLALFGHIHECGGEEVLVEGIRCVNVSTYHKLFR